MRAEIHREGSVGGADGPHHLAEDLGARAKSAVLLRDVESHEPELRHPFAHAVGELSIVVVLLAIHRV